MNGKPLLMISCIVLMSACGGAATQAPTSAPTSAPAASKPAAAAQPTTAPAPTTSSAAKSATQPTSAAPAAAADVRNIGSLNEGLDKLKSYRMAWKLNYEGKDDKGTLKSGGWDMLQEYISDSKDQHLRWKTTDDKGKQDGLEIFRVGEATYWYSPDAQGKDKCVAMSSSDAKSGGAIEPWAFFSGMQNAKLARKGETVNGVVADHYTVDEKSAGLGFATSGSGDVWVAQDGGFVVKYQGKFTGKGGAALLLGGTGEGTLTSDYEVSEVNKIKEIVPPAECAKPGTSLPMPPNVTDKMSIQGMTTFKTGTAADKVVAFYKAQLPPLGYKLDQEDAMGDVTQLQFSKQDNTVTLMIAREGDATTVVIQEEAK